MPFVDLSERFPPDMLDNWAHLAFTADAMRIYRDGELLKQGPGTAPFVRAEHGPWHIGGRSTNTFMGKVDEFAVFNVVLSEADINSVMINGIEGAVLSVSPEGRAATTWARLKAGK